MAVTNRSPWRGVSGGGGRRGLYFFIYHPPGPRDQDGAKEYGETSFHGPLSARGGAIRVPVHRWLSNPRNGPFSLVIGQLLVHRSGDAAGSQKGKREVMRCPPHWRDKNYALFVMFGTLLTFILYSMLGEPGQEISKWCLLPRKPQGRLPLPH